MIIVLFFHCGGLWRPRSGGGGLAQDIILDVSHYCYGSALRDLVLRIFSGIAVGRSSAGAKARTSGGGDPFEGVAFPRLRLKRPTLNRFAQKMQKIINRRPPLLHPSIWKRKHNNEDVYGTLSRSRCAFAKLHLCRDGKEAPGGLRPDTIQDGVGSEGVSCTIHPTDSARRKGFGGKYQLEQWPTAAAGRPKRKIIPPRSYQLESWPIEAQLGEWCPILSRHKWDSSSAGRTVEADRVGCNELYRERRNLRRPLAILTWDAVLESSLDTRCKGITGKRRDLPLTSIQLGDVRGIAAYASSMKPPGTGHGSMPWRVGD